MEKLAIRTKDQLEIRRNNFKQIVDILDNLKINFFLEGGVLLGAIRENDFIKWDWDVEIAFFSNEFEKKFDDILINLKKAGFTILNYNKSYHHQKINFYKQDPPEITCFSLFGWSYNKLIKSYVRKDIKIPEHFLTNMKKIKFLQKFVYAPSPVEEYLEFKYGNWKVPLRSAEKTIYLTKNHYKKNSLNLDLKLDKMMKKLFKSKI